jgi:GLPGLI family protein
MKKLALFIIGLLCCTVSNGQNAKNNRMLAKSKFECLYEYQVKNRKGSIDSYSTILQIGGHCACFEDYSAFQCDSAEMIPGVAETVINKYSQQKMKNDLFFDQTVYQNEPKGLLSVYSVIVPDYYTYTENAQPMAWKLIDSTKTVCGYVCKKATGEYGGRMWTAWYAPEITVSFGPWKLCGLPGLVMAASDAEGIHQFSAIGFRKGTTQILTPGFLNAVSTTRAKFVKAKNKFEENPMGNLPIEAISEMTIMKHDDGSKGSVLINGVQLRIRPNGYVPLELE